MKSLMYAALCLAWLTTAHSVYAAAVEKTLGFLPRDANRVAERIKNTKAAQEELCKNTVGESTFVNLDKLAEKILLNLGFEQSDLGELSQRTLAGLIFALENDTEYPVADASLPRVKAAIAKLPEETISIQGILISALDQPDAFKSYGYVVHVPGSQFLQIPGEPSYLDLFAGHEAITIECLVLRDRDSSTTVFHRFASFISEESDNRLRLRGTVSDLKKPANAVNLKDLSWATVSYVDNNAKGSTTFAVDGVLGLDLSTEDGTLFIPYAKYKQSETRKGGGTTEVEVLTLGFLFSKLFLHPDLSFAVDLSPSATLDLEQKAEVVALEGSVEPAFDLLTVPIGVFSFHGPFRIRPDIKLDTAANYVLDAGFNPLLRNDDDYFRFGGKAGLEIQFVDLPFLSDISLKGSYEWHYFASSPLDDLDRLEASVNYFLGGSLHYLLSFEYVNGRNIKSLQKEEFWKVSLGARF